MATRTSPKRAIEYGTSRRIWLISSTLSTWRERSSLATPRTGSSHRGSRLTARRVRPGSCLSGSFATLRGNEDLEEFVASTISMLRDPIDPDFVRKFQEGTFLKPVPQSFIDAAVADTLKVPAHVWRAAFEGLLLEDHTSELRAIEAPTLIVWGIRIRSSLVIGRRSLSQRSPTSSWSCTRVSATVLTGRSQSASPPILSPSSTAWERHPRPDQAFVDAATCETGMLVHRAHATGLAALRRAWAGSSP